MRDLFLLTFWTIATPLSFMSPAAGVTFWIWDALLAPTELVYGFMGAIPTNKIVAIVTLIGLSLRQDKRDLYLDRVGYLLLALGVTATFSHLSSLTAIESESYIYQKVLKEIALAFALMFTITNRRWIVVCIIVLSASISFLGVKEGLISLLTAGGHKIIGSRAVGDNNQLALVLLSTVPMLMFLSKYFEKRWLRIGSLAVIALDLITVIMTFSRGGFIGLIVLALLYLKNTRNRLQSSLVLIVIGLSLAALAPEAWYTRVDTINDAADDGSFMGRVIAWKISFLIAEYNPFFGGGFHALQDWRVWETYSKFFGELSWVPTALPDFYPHAAHSIVFEVLGDLGFIGFFTYFLLFALSFLSLRSVKALCAEHSQLRWARDLASMLQMSLILYLICGLALSVAYVELIFVFFALSSRLRRTVLQAKAVLSLSVAGTLGMTKSNKVLHPAMRVGLNTVREL